MGARTILDVEALVEDCICKVPCETQSVVSVELLGAKTLAADLEENAVESLWKDQRVPSFEALAS